MTYTDLPQPSLYGPSATVYLPGGYLDAWGHSYVFGSGAVEPREGFVPKLAQMLQVKELNNSSGGSLLAAHYSPGGWVSMFQGITRASTGDIDIPGNQVGLLMSGINDVNALGNTATALEPVKQTFRSVVSRMMTSRIIEDEDASVVYGGSWFVVVGVLENSGSQYHYTTTNGVTYTITTPSLPAGSTIAIGITARDAAQGATHTFTLDGRAHGSIAAYGGASGKGYFPYVYRLTNLSAGVHTIVGTVSGVTTLTSFDYYQVESPTQPLVLLPLQPYPIDYTAYGSVAPGPPTDAGVDALNTIINSVASEFGAVAVDLTGMGRVIANFASDKLHPSDVGHGIIARRIAGTVNTNHTLLPGPLSKLQPSYATNIPLVASATALVVPRNNDIIQVTGTTTITSITTIASDAGRRLTIIFSSTATLTDGSNLKLASSLVATADDTISLVCDGTNWYETGRSVN